MHGDSEAKFLVVALIRPLHQAWNSCYYLRQAAEHKTP